jgi:hypothetical protein
VRSRKTVGGKQKAGLEYGVTAQRVTGSSHTKMHYGFNKEAAVLLRPERVKKLTAVQTYPGGSLTGWPIRTGFGIYVKR